MISSKKIKFMSKFLFALFIIAWGIGDLKNNIGDDFKYIFFLLHLMFLAIIFGLKHKKEKLVFSYEFKKLTILMVFFLLISIFFQFINNKILMNTYKELFYIFFPILYVFLIANVEEKKDLKFYFYFTGIVFMSVFLIRAIPNLNLANILSISFIKSYSPFEGIGSADIFLIVYIFSIISGNKKMAILSFVFCVLSFKRLHVIMAIIFPLIYILINRKKISFINNKVYNATKIVFIISPILINLLTSNDFSNWFKNNTGIDFNSFTMGRFYTINYIIDNKFENLGLGTITTVLLQERNLDPYLADDLHCDLMRIYLETTIIGLYLLVSKYFKITRKNIYNYIIITFSFVVMFSSHILTTFIYWIFVYLFILYMNYDFYERREKKNE